jgi:hypothetical protein
MVKILGFGPGYNEEVEIESTNESAKTAALDYVDAWTTLYTKIVQPVVRAELARIFPVRLATEPGADADTETPPPASELDDPDRDDAEPPVPPPAILGGP